MVLVVRFLGGSNVFCGALMGIGRVALGVRAGACVGLEDSENIVRSSTIASGSICWGACVRSRVSHTTPPMRNRCNNNERKKPKVSRMIAPKKYNNRYYIQKNTKEY